MTPLAGHAGTPPDPLDTPRGTPPDPLDTPRTAGHAARPAGHTAGRGRRAEPREVATRGLRCASASVGVWAGSELASPSSRPRAPGPRGEAEAKVCQPKARWSAQGSPKGSPQGPPSQGPQGPSVLQTSRLQGFKDPHPKVAPKCPDWPGAGAWGPCPRPGPGARDRAGPSTWARSSGPRGLGARAECVVALCCEPRGLGLGLGLPGPGPEARRAKGRWAQGPGPGTGAPNTQPLCLASKPLSRFI